LNPNSDARPIFESIGPIFESIVCHCIPHLHPKTSGVIGGRHSPSGGTPKTVIEKLNGAAVEALADPVVRQRLASLEVDIFPPSEQTSASLGLLVKSDIAKWWPIIKAAGIKDE
jgi:hypothetical protein